MPRGRTTHAKSGPMKGWGTEDYNDWTKTELYKKAKQMGIEGRSEMSKRQLVQALKKSW